MNDQFDDLLDRIRGMALAVGDYIILGSVPLCVRGIIPSCKDLVCSVTGPCGTTSVHRENWFTYTSTVTATTLCNGRITFGTEWAIGDVDELIVPAEIIDGLAFAPFEAVVHNKTTRNSAKDREHVELLVRSGFSSKSK